MRNLGAIFAVAGVAAVAAVVVACGGGGSLKAAGEVCVASSDCEAGLVCDFGRNPPVCASMGTIPPDGSEVEVDAPDIDGGVDAPPDAAVPIDAAVDAPDAI
jgi:hypothetical protein